MKNFLLLIFLASASVSFGQASRVLRIIYIDNFGASSTGDKGLPPACQSYIDANITTLTEDRYLFYLPNGTTPIFSLNNEEDMNNLLSGIPKERTVSSNIFYDKQKIWGLLSEYSDLKFTKIECHFFLSYEFFKGNIINYEIGFFSTYFLRELQYTFQPEKVDFIYYHDEEDPKVAAKIQARVAQIYSFYNEGIFEGKTVPTINILK